MAPQFSLLPAIFSVAAALFSAARGNYRFCPGRIALLGKQLDKGGRAIDNQPFVEIVLYLACSGSLVAILQVLQGVL